ncbi:MAG: hypothetical protein ACREJC_17760 [Tepidisphaeraceae bacterium]
MSIGHCRGKLRSVVIVISWIVAAPFAALARSEGPPEPMAPSTQPTPLLPQVPGPPVILPRSAELQDVGIRFSYPSDFRSGKYTSNFDPDEFFAKAFVLVEARLVTDDNITTLPLGGSVPAVSIHHVDASATDFLTRVIQPRWQTKIGAHLVFKMPGFPGPCGEEAHCYFLPLSDGTSLVVTGHRWHLGSPPETRVPTHYDWVIERIIGTMQIAGSR